MGEEVNTVPPRNARKRLTPEQAPENPLQPLVRMIVQEVMREMDGRTEVPASKRLLSPEDAAAYLSLSKREVYNMIANEQIAAVRHGRRKMLDIRDLEKWIEDNKR